MQVFEESKAVGKSHLRVIGRKEQLLGKEYSEANILPLILILFSLIEFGSKK